MECGGTWKIGSARPNRWLQRRVEPNVLAAAKTPIRKNPVKRKEKRKSVARFFLESMVLGGLQGVEEHIKRTH
jgi:hypothetical protein